MRRGLGSLYDRGTAAAVLLAVGLTVLDAAKPLHVDDYFFSVYARQVAAHPLDPYGFAPVLNGEVVPANHALAPPVLPYWWGAGMALFGERPVLWKLWLFPFALALVLSLRALVCRLAPGLETLLVTFVVFSPVVLPGFNLMMDVPALALALSAVAFFASAADRDSWSVAFAAGVLAGLSMQTKYTGVTSVGAILLYAAAMRRWSLGVAAAGASAIVFVAWELFVFCSYGESHFVFEWQHHISCTRGQILRTLPVHMGGVAPTLALLALAACRTPFRYLLAAALVIVVGYVGVIYLPRVQLGGLVIDPETNQGVPDWPELIFGSFGLLVLLTLGQAIWKLCPSCWPPDDPSKALDWYLAAWFALEVAGSVFISPFPAARRMLGPVTVGSLLLGRLAARTPVPGLARRVTFVTLFGALLGLGYYLVDWCEAIAEKQAAEQAAQICARDPASSAYSIGYFGFEYYANRAGMPHLVINIPSSVGRYPNGRRLVIPEPTRLRIGDWLVIAHPEARRFRSVPGLRLEPIERVEITDPLPARTLWGYYTGLTPLRRAWGPRIEVLVVRVRAQPSRAGP